MIQYVIEPFERKMRSKKFASSRASNLDILLGRSVLLRPLMEFSCAVELQLGGQLGTRLLALLAAPLSDVAS